MSYPWENEEWYLAQKPRWEALESRGWKFSSQVGPITHTGIMMYGVNGERFHLQVRGRKNAQRVHTALLEKCEYHANYGRESLNDACATTSTASARPMPQL